MFFLFAALACLLAVLNSHFLDGIDSDQVYSAALILISGMAVFSNNSMRHRSVLDVFFVWTVWVVATDGASYFPSILASMETTIFITLISWVYWRPYFHNPVLLDTDTVHIAFYGGPNAPPLSRLASHIGFPFSSVAIVAGLRAVRPSKVRGEMVATSKEVLDAKGYRYVDTGVVVTPEIYEKLTEVIGTSTKYGIFRVRCLSNFKPVLAELGKQWEPKGWPMIPSIYYRKCMDNIS